MHWRGIEPWSPEWQARILPQPPMQQKIVKAFWTAATNAKKKWGNVGALNFGGAMEQHARGYSSLVDLSTADRMVSGSNPDVPYLLGIGVPCK